MVDRRLGSRVVYQQINKDHAYWTEKRRHGQLRGGHTAGLLTHWRGSEVCSRILFDAGLQTIEGLYDLEDFDWSGPLAVFVTHGHIDHHAELMLLSELWSKREAKHGPLRVHCTGSDMTTPKSTINVIWPVHQWGFTGGKTLVHIPVVPGKSSEVGILTVHAVEVDHFPGAVIFVVDFGENPVHRVVIGWDMKTLPSPDDHPVLKNPSLALLEANTQSALSHRTGHTSAEELVTSGFLSALNVEMSRPEVYGIRLVHYGGKEDPGGAVSDAEFERAFLKRHREWDGLVRVGKRGERWEFTV